MKFEKGLVQIYEGNGKGKTTAAFGLALRAVGRNIKTHIIQFLKCSNRYGELAAAQKLAPLLKVTQAGRPCLSDDGSPDFVCTGCMKCHVDPSNPSQEDIDCARRGLKLALENSRDGSCNLLILDELNYALSFGLLKVADVLALIKSKNPDVEIVITGRGTPPELAEAADLVTTVMERKHHYEKGLSEVEGIDY